MLITSRKRIMWLLFILILHVKLRFFFSDHTKVKRMSILTRIISEIRWHNVLHLSKSITDGYCFERVLCKADTRHV